MAPEHVRICPVCDAENPSDRSLCACGASLAGVDFSLKGYQAPFVADIEPVAPLPPAATVTCPHADCAQANPVGIPRCLYCNRPLAAPQAPPNAKLRWPWGETTAVGKRLTVGREAPAPEALAARLERDFANTSRRHAEFAWRDGALWLTDLASLNGTFVDGVRLSAHRPVRVRNGQQLRFGADLAVQVELDHDGDENEQPDPA